jgi:hypothetical protein
MNKHYMGWGEKSKGCLIVIVEMGKEDVTGKTVLEWLGEGVAVLPVPTLL